MISQKAVIRAALVAASLLLIPFFGNIYVEGWNWPWYTFVLAGVMLFAAGLVFELAVTKARNRAQRLAAALAVAAAFVLTWTNMVITSESENPANLLYFGVPLIGLAGALIARFQPRGLARTLFAMAVAQLAVPLIALLFGNSNFAPGLPFVLGRNAAFAVLFLASAWLFRRTMRPRH